MRHKYNSKLQTYPLFMGKSYHQFINTNILVFNIPLKINIKELLFLWSSKIIPIFASIPKGRRILM